MPRLSPRLFTDILSEKRELLYILNKYNNLLNSMLTDTKCEIKKTVIKNKISFNTKITNELNHNYNNYNYNTVEFIQQKNFINEKYINLLNKLNHR
jgi:hypothetical protein